MLHNPDPPHYTPMARYQILSENRPEIPANATTGDPRPRIGIVVEWDGQPTPEQKRQFDAQYPPHLYQVFAFIDGGGRVE